MVRKLLFQCGIFLIHSVSCWSSAFTFVWCLNHCCWFNPSDFVNEIKKFGHEAIIYTYPYWLTNFYILDEIRDIPMWYAQYDVSKPEIDNPIMIWQYSNKGTINGISKDTDLNIMFIRKESN